MVERVQLESLKYVPKVYYVTCPWCGERGPGEILQNRHDIRVTSGEKTVFAVGERICPNPYCHGLYFLLATINWTTQHFITYPKPRIQYDRNKVPEAIAKSFDEAVLCYSHGCYMAAGAMIRKSVEAICDHLGATGKMLGQRLQDLKNKPHVNEHLIELMTELNYLGTDAAHIEMRHFDNLGDDEIAAGIEAVKVLIRDLYQYEVATEKLRALKSSEEDNDGTA